MMWCDVCFWTDRSAVEMYIIGNFGMWDMALLFEPLSVFNSAIFYCLAIIRHSYII